MKKLLSLIAIAILGVGITFAQTPVATKAATTKANAQVAVKKVETKATTTKTTAPVVVKKEVKKVTAPTSATAAKLKADGTPDMRYAENKAKKAVVGPTKKDGTADMRYKANKAAAKKN